MQAENFLPCVYNETDSTQYYGLNRTHVVVIN